MRLHTDLLLAAATFAALGLAVPTSAPVSTAISAEFRFTNNTNANATVNANGEALWTDVSPKQTTEWSTLTDSTVRFTMTVPGEGKDPATVTQVVVDGARYTVTADVGMGGDPQLSVKREGPMPAPDTAGQH